MQMKKQLIGLLVACSAVVLVTCARGEVTMAKVYSSDMVLQRDAPLRFSGWADPGEKVTVEFGGKAGAAVAGKDGRWRVELAAEGASTKGREVVVRGAENEIRLQNVVVGDVWLASGQSNMGFSFGSVADKTNEFAKAERVGGVRFIIVNDGLMRFPQEDVLDRYGQFTRWQTNAVKHAGVSAVGYLFAQKLHLELGIPVGLISAPVGGSGITPYIPGDEFRTRPPLKEWAKRWVARRGAPREAERGWRYNCMIHPFTGLPIKGVVWYQGEAESVHNDGAKLYFEKMRALIEGWRAAWKDDFPFYYVQVAPFAYGELGPGAYDSLAAIREGQCRALALPKTGMAVTMDVGEVKDIHPRNKQDVADRLAAWALAKTYGRKTPYSGPIYKSMKVEGDKVRISFEHAESGLMTGVKSYLPPRSPVVETKGVPVGDLSVKGGDGKWHWADSRIEGSELVVFSPDVKDPVAVRYATRRTPKAEEHPANLYNRDGLPASPFATENNW